MQFEGMGEMKALPAQNCTWVTVFHFYSHFKVCNWSVVFTSVARVHSGLLHRCACL